MGLVTPNPGTIFWMLLIFGIVVYILQRFAWKPILNALTERENSIKEALSSADLARKQMDELKADQNLLKINSLKEKEQILKDAREIKDKIISEAKEKAGQEGMKLMAQIREQIEIEKLAAIHDIKQQVAELSVNIAEKILKEKLEKTPQQEKLINSQLEEFKLN
jgi:F-type H+-transporting ATPase subunit b